jgi:hypothetical protein
MEALGWSSSFPAERVEGAADAEEDEATADVSAGLVVDDCEHAQRNRLADAQSNVWISPHRGAAGFPESAAHRFIAFGILLIPSFSFRISNLIRHSSFVIRIYRISGLPRPAQSHSDKSAPVPIHL